METPPLVALDGVIRDYAWGSRTAIPDLLGIEPTERPAAELWLGAHPGDPSPVPALATTLDQLIARDPESALGARSIERFGPELPFLMKILAAERALSIQVHPNLEQARAGFAAEQAAGLATNAPQRNYSDRNHKPELLYALTPFDVLSGFRPVGDTIAVLDALGVAELGFVSALLSGPDGLRAAFTAIITHDDPAALVDAMSARLDAGGPQLEGVRLAAQAFPGDIGLVVGLLLNYARLEPGEAIFLGAGNLHAYLRGTGVEVMASSDNVLRCGLTPKHIDVAEVLRIAAFTELADPRWLPEGGVFRVPVPDFALTVEAEAAPAGPRVVLALDAPVRLAADGAELDLAPGRAAFVLASAGEVTVSGPGRVVIASPG